jgi:hypothetical protein
MIGSIPSWTVRAGCVAALGALLFGSAALAGGTRQPIMIELFTSQGCSSCPEADAFMGDLQARQDVVAVSFNIDYWDYIGWRDTLASHENTLRQQAYAKVLSSHQVYTPEMVIDGDENVPGNQRDKALAIIEHCKTEDVDDRIPVTLRLAGDEVDVDLGAGPKREATVWMAHTASSRTVDIGRGENRGRVVTYHNVVRSFAAVGKFSGDPMTLRLPIKGQPGENSDGIVVWVQTGEMGKILGAAQIKLPHK